MSKRYFSISELSFATGIDRRTVRKRLHDIAAHSGEKGAHLYDGHDAFPRLFLDGNTYSEVERLIQKENLKLVRSKSATAEIELKVLKEKFIDIEQVAHDVEQEYSFVRSRLLKIPTNIAVQLSSVKNAVEAKKIAEDAINEALEELQADAKYRLQAEGVTVVALDDEPLDSDIQE